MSTTAPRPAPTLVTGARGRIGRAVVARLRAAGGPVRAASRHPAGLDLPADVETVELVLSDPATFAGALRGARRVFLYPEPAGIDELLHAAGAAGVEHVVLLSSSSVTAPGAEGDPLARPSLEVERALARSRLPTTLLRPDAFASNALGWARPVRARLPVQLAHPDAHVAAVHPDDVADVAVAALTGDVLTGRTLTLTGPESLTFRRQLAVIGGLLGREVVVERVDREQAVRQMGARVPAAVAAALLDLWADACAGPAPVRDTAQTVLGVPARTFGRWAGENLAAFA